MGPVATVEQVFAVYWLLEEALAGVHVATGVGPVVKVAQVVAV
jgi:hypothetical protein